MFGHVLGAIVWIGLGLVGMSMAVWADRHGEHAFVEPVYRWVAWIEPPAIVHGPLLLIVTGVALVLDGPWRFGGHVDRGRPRRVRHRTRPRPRSPGSRDEAGEEADGGARAGGPETIAATRRLDAFLWPELGVLLVVLLAMTTKPVDGGTLGFWAVAALALLGALLPTVRGLRAASSSSVTR